MGILKKLYSQKKEKPLQELNRVLEKDIFKLLDEAESLLNLDHKRGTKLLQRADRLYDLRGYDFKVECRINNVCFSYMEKYPPVLFSLTPDI